MKFTFIIFIVVGFFQIGTAQNNDYFFKAVPFTNVTLTDNFWLPKITINNNVTIPASFERCEKTGRIKNFEMAATHTGKFCTTFSFDDTDIYKTIEGASYAMRFSQNKKLIAYIDSLIVIIANAQEPDGYLYTARTIDSLNPHKWAGNKRWEKERELSHELYNAGHLYESAVAHFEATGNKKLLNIAIKNANLVCSVFGNNKLHVAPGHQIVEMGLVKLFRITGNKKYLETAKFFIDERGHFNGYDKKSKDPWKNGSYWQDHIPVIKQTEAIGHAVRAGYLYAGMADVAALTGDATLINAVDSIWNNLVSKKLYIQGGAGAVGSGERYGENYELPNATAYNETCAAIANVFFNQRMFQLHGHAKYIDVLEKILYNGLISGVGLDGKSFFYTNAMEIKNNVHHADKEAERSGWFECSCCPTNICRMLPAIPGYMYAQKEDNIFINLFAESTTNIKVKNKNVTITQQNNYPWNGQLKFIVKPTKATEFNLLIRIPGWAQNNAIPSNLYNFQNVVENNIAIKINGIPVKYQLENGYAILNKEWKSGDLIEVDLPMEIQRVSTNDKVKNNIGKVALQRGPIMYCAEWADNNGKTSNIILPKDVKFESVFKPTMLNGITILQTKATVVEVDKNVNSVTTTTKPFIAIPYFAWANRGKGEMTIWFPEKIKEVEILTN